MRNHVKESFIDFQIIDDGDTSKLLYFLLFEDGSKSIVILSLSFLSERLQMNGHVAFSTGGRKENYMLNIVENY